jgi:DNA-binding GntR family transcriptional regulator
MPDSNPWTMPPKRSLPEIVAERIVEAIRSGHLKPGERIVELTLSKELGVSRGPLREALKALQANHLVETRARGTYVRAVSDDDLVRMVMLRANLEGFAARFVAAAMTPQIVETLTDLLRQGRAAADEGRTSDWRDLDWRFHETVVALADNPFLLSSWQAISNLVRLFLHTHAVFEKEVPATLANHDKLFAALVSGDPDRAEHAFRSIILGSAFRRFGRAFPDALASLQGAAPPLRPGASEEPAEAPHVGPRIRML